MNGTRVSIATILVVLYMFILSCDKSSKNNDNIIASVNKEMITEEDLAALADSSYALYNMESKQKLTEDWIKLTVLAQEAKSRGYDKLPEVQSKINYAEKRVLANTLIAEIVANIKVSEGELFNYYQIHKSRFTGERQEYQLQRILVETESVVDRIANEINSNTINFTDAAKQYSVEPIGKNGGFVGFVTSDDIEEILLERLIKAGQRRFIKVKEGNKFLLVRYTEKRMRTIDKPFTEVKSTLRDEIIEEKKREFIEKEINFLINQAEIVITK